MGEEKVTRKVRVTMELTVSHADVSITLSDLRKGLGVVIETDVEYAETEVWCNRPDDLNATTMVTVDTVDSITVEFPADVAVTRQDRYAVQVGSLWSFGCRACSRLRKCDSERLMECGDGAYESLPVYDRKSQALTHGLDHLIADHGLKV